MGKKKIGKSDNKLQVVPAPVGSKPALLTPEAEEELKELIRQINSMAQKKRKKGRQEEPHREHGPDLPPAA